MIDNLEWKRAALLGALVLTTPLATAHAQVLVRTADGFSCQPLADQVCTSDFGCDTGDFCRSFGTISLCTPGEAIFCCSEASDCPLASPRDEATTCHAVSGVSGAGGLCLPDRDYCGATSLEGILDCHTTPMGALVRSWGAGDCDGDGFENALEMRAGTDPCAAPGPVAFFDGEMCAPLDTGCAPIGGTCLTNDGSGICTTTGDGLGSFCAPAEDTLYCCGSTVCPTAGDICVTLEAASVCVDSLCAERMADLSACVTDADGEPVPFADGDCDSDGVTNGDELAAESDPCAADGTVDAGAIADAGVPGEDAGGTGMREDGGVPPGPELDVRFEGGGGCACRVMPARSSSAPMLALLGIALALVLARRR